MSKKSEINFSFGKFVLDSSNDYFLVIINNNNSFPASDDNLAELIKLSTEEFQKIMISKFNAFMGDGERETYFSTKEDVQNAMDFMNTTYKLMDK